MFPLLFHSGGRGENALPRKKKETDVLLPVELIVSLTCLIIMLTRSYHANHAGRMGHFGPPVAPKKADRKFPA